MTEILNILPDTIFLMATLFAGMSKGGNESSQQSGKLTFKKLVEGTGICFTEDARGITISAVGTGAAVLDACEIAHGTGIGITSSNFCIADSQRAIFGFSSIRAEEGSGYASTVQNSCNSLIIGGQQHVITDARTSVILGGRENCVSAYGQSIIIGGSINQIFASASSIISSREGIVNNLSHFSSLISTYCSGTRLMSNSTFISSYRDYSHGDDNFTGKSPTMFTSISTICTQHNNIPGSGQQQGTLICGSKVNYNSAISGRVNCFSFPQTNSVISQGSIISSEYSCICSYKDPKTNNPECSIGASILSSYCVRNAHKCSSIISSLCSVSNGSNVGYSDLGFNTILSSYRSCVNQTRSNSIIASKDAYGPVDSPQSGASSILSSEYSSTRDYRTSIISSYRGRAGIINSSVISSRSSYSEDRTSLIAGSCFSESLVQFGNFRGSEGKVPNISFGSEQTCFHFATIGQIGGFSYGNSIMIGGSDNTSGRTMNEDNFKNYYCECKYGENRAAIVGGYKNCSSASDGVLIVGGLYNCELNTTNSSIIGSCNSCIYANGRYQKIRNFVNTRYYNPSLQNSVQNSFILGGRGNYFRSLLQNKYMLAFNPYGAYKIQNSGIIGGQANQIQSCTNGYYSRAVYGFNCPGLTSSVILGGDSKENRRSFNLLVENLFIEGTIKTCKGPSLATLCTGVSGVFSSPTELCVVNGLVVNVA